MDLRRPLCDREGDGMGRERSKGNKGRLAPGEKYK